MRRVKRGLFITFEGIEGSGKTTQIGLTAQSLKKRGIPFLLTREPGGTPFADQIRTLLLHSRPGSINPETELFLYEVARRDHVDSLIRPALQKGRWVLCDRFSDATLAYQGFGRGLPLKTIELMNEIATGGLKPNLTFLFDFSPRLGLQRVLVRGKKLDRLEQETLRFHQRVRKGYLTLAQKEKRRFRILHAAKSRTEILQQILRDLENLL